MFCIDNMRPTTPKTEDKEKGVKASPSNTYFQTILGNHQFKPQALVEQTSMDRI